MHHTHDHQNAAAGANTSLAHHEQGALGNPVAMSYIGSNNRTLDNLFSLVSVFLVQQRTELERGIAPEQSGPWSSCVAAGVFNSTMKDL